MKIDFQSPICALWKNKDHDLPVVLTSVIIHEKGVFFQIMGSKTCLPYREVLLEDKNVINAIYEAYRSFHSIK